jgi:hypothetical protein
MRTQFFALRGILVLAGVLHAPGNPSSFINGPEHEGDAITCDLPSREHLTNIGSRRDGRGMCVMSSLEMAARWQGLDQLAGLRDWCANQPGGAYPAKVDRQLRDFCQAKSVPLPAYLQYEGRNPGPILDLCEKTGRMACITYGRSPRYAGTIAHMVCCAKYGDRWAVVLDNNFPGERSYEWMPREEILRRIAYPDGNAWVFVWLAPPPPPIPHNP